MSRIIPLLLAMGITLSASALEHTTALHPAVRQQGISFSQPVLTLPQHQRTPEMSAARIAAATATESGEVAAAAMLAPEQSNAVIQVTGTRFAYVQKFQGDWFMSFFSDPQADGDYYMMKYDFKNPDPDSPRGHYTSLTDLNLQYSYAHSESAQLDTIRYARIDMTVTEDEEGALTMEGDVWSTKGQQYHVHIAQPAPIKPKDTFDLEIVCDPKDCYLSNSESAYFGYDATTGLYAQVAVKGKLTGEFDKDHIMTDYTLVTPSLQTPAIGIAEQQSCTVTMDEQRLFDVRASFVGTDSIRYNIHMTMQLPEGGEPIEVNITNAQASSYWGYFMTQGYNATYEAQASGVMALGKVEDLSTFSAAVANRDEATVGYSLFMHEAELSQDADGQLIVTCAFYANDYKEYRLDMRYVVTEPKDTITFTITDAEYINALDKEQAQRLQGDCDDYGVQITMLHTTETAGTFSIDAGDAWGYLYDYETDRTLSFISGTVFVTLDETGHIVCQISGNAMDIDVHHYEITLHSEWDTEYIQQREYDAQTGELNAAFWPTDEVTMENHIANGNYLYFNAYSAARGEVLTLAVYSPKKDKKIFFPEGTYQIDDSEAMYTVQASEGVYDQKLYPSYYARKDADGYLEVPVWMLERGTMTVTNVDNQLTFVIDAINSYKRPIHITYNCTVEALQQVTVPDHHSGKRMEQGRLVIYRDLMRYNGLGVRY